jgi:hypothetical protein
MNWTEDEIDDLFKNADNQQSFEYQSEYWKDIEKQLPIKKSRKPFLWWFSANVFLTIFIGLFIVELVQLPSEGLSNKIAKETNPLSSQKLVIKNSTAITGNYDNKLNLKRIPAQVKANNLSKLLSNKVVENGILNKQLISNGSDQTTESNGLLSSEIAYYLGNEIIETPKSVNKNSDFQQIILSTKPLELAGDKEQLLESDKFFNRRNKLEYFIELNGGMQQGWSRSAELSINGTAGISAGIVLPVKQFKVKIGAGLKAINFDDLYIKEQARIYGFGSNLVEKKYEFGSMYSLTIPLDLSYSIGRHNLSLGVISSFNLLASFKKTEVVDGTNMVSSKGITGVKLFNKISLEPSLGYSYSVNENVQIGMRLGMNLLQPVQSQRFSGSMVKAPINGQIFIVRTLNF